MTLRGVWVGKSNEDEWRTRVFSFPRASSFSFPVRFDGCIFIFHQLRVGAKNTTFPFSSSAHTHSKANYEKKALRVLFSLILSSSAQLTRQSSSADIKVFATPPATQHQTKKMENSKAKDFYPCVCTKHKSLRR